MWEHSQVTSVSVLQTVAGKVQYLGKGSLSVRMYVHIRE